MTEKMSQKVIAYLQANQNSESTNYPLYEGRNRIGRVKNNDVILNSIGVSSRHCDIYIEEGKFSILDLKSKNGVFLKNFIEEDRIPTETKVDIEDGAIFFISDFECKIH